jgi:hypothetical protein
MYYVNYWGSHPDEGNDDCWCGQDYQCESEALAAYSATPDAIGCPTSDVAWVEFGRYTGQIVNGAREVERLQIRSNPYFRPSRNDREEWKRERAWEAGMLHGVEAYNDAMGY